MTYSKLLKITLVIVIFVVIFNTTGLLLCFWKHVTNLIMIYGINDVAAIGLFHMFYKLYKDENE